MKKIFFLFVLLFPSLALADPLEGYWQTEDKDAIIEFMRCKESFCGRFVWLKEDSAEMPSLDDKNKSPDRRGRPLCGMTFLEGFKKEKNNVYGGGWIYSPRHGSSFSAEITMLNEDTLSLRGYVFIPLFGDTQTWRRITNPVLCWKMQKN